jgi:hypothetical protein
MGDVLLIAGGKDPVAADYADHCAGRVCAKVCLVRDPEGCAAVGGSIGGAVLFLPRRLTESDRAILQEAVAVARKNAAGCVCVISSFRVHLGDRDAARVEAFVLECLWGFSGRVVVFRPGHVLSPRSRLSGLLRGAWFCFPLVSGRLRSCCVEGEELFAAIDEQLSPLTLCPSPVATGGSPVACGFGQTTGGPPVATGEGRKSRTFALLGRSLSWQARLRGHGKGHLARAYVALAAVLFPLAALRLLAGLLFAFAARRSPRLRAWHLDTLRPRSIKELLELYNPYNYRHVKVVGYNNGVVHFGQQFPGKTVVSTVRCNRLARLAGTVGEFDAGVTIRQATDVLGPRGKELPVLPNYSYVSLGTSFFIPIHGSASTVSTVAETIEKVLLYDPIRDRCVTARRSDPAFAHYLYNLAADVLLLRVWVQTKDKARYFVRRVESRDPPAGDVWSYFHDSQAANVEVRKAGSAADLVQVSRYYTEEAGGDGAALELPRDALGRLWDRLEENPISSVLFHALVRSLAFHVELFLPEKDFAVFWDSHRRLPILKIQLRFIRKDGFPHSPFREQDCIAADLFLRRKHRKAFETYLEEMLPAAACNPGKHSA